MCYTILYHNRSFSHDVTAAIFVYKTMDRRPYLCTKKILWELNSFHMLKLLLFQAIWKAADHVTENDLYNCTCIIFTCIGEKIILGDPVADSRGEGKSKRAEKYSTKKSKERREEPLWTMSYHISSKRSPPFWLLIGQKNTNVFWHQSEARTVATV